MTRAQETYRRRLRLVEPGETEEADAVAFAADRGQSIGDVWPLIAEVLSRELHGHPELLDRVLLALANARRPEPGSEEAVSSV